ncbi:MAG TPA: hypothetical protein VKQ27_15625 [Acetobacteraceae bacterium]|jgi:hypothetical protein|nr:hypothetical protein [Acetobacteraceae bacterium]
MPQGTGAPFIYLVQMDIPAEHEADFNRVYDTEHVPEILKVPGVRACSRYVLERTNKTGLARYLALYEVDSAEVIDSPAWTKAAEIGDWAPKIRPHTTNRSHTVMRKIS